MPSKAVPVQPEQFRKSTYDAFGSFLGSDDSTSCWFTFSNTITSEAGAFNAGDIIEAVYGGPTPCTGFRTIVDGGYKTANINPGDKLYLAIGSQGTTSTVKKGIWFANLAHALGSPSRYGTNTPSALDVLPTGALLPVATTANINPITQESVLAIASIQKKRYLYYRKIVEGGQQDTTA